MKSKKLREIINDPEANLSQILDITMLENTIENNDWHLSQSVLDHTLKVFKHLENIFQLEFPYSSNLNPHKDLFINYMVSKVNNKHSRLNLLKFAALLHDIGKPDTIVINNNGITSCPNHAIISADMFRKLSDQFDIDSIEKDYILQIIKKHHNHDNFIGFMDSADYREKKSFFIKENKIFSVDLLAFYLADFEGCDVNDQISKTKSSIYSEVINTIGSCLDEFKDKYR